MSIDWRETIRRQRAEKDDYFAEHPQSPIPDDERDSFEGLDHFPIDEAFRFTLALREHDEKERVTVSTSTEGEREYLRWGEFRFEVDGEEATLQAYKTDREDARLWVPFRDATSGEETYGAGRYLDLEPADHRTDDGEWVVDFNEAYNPTCAYSDRYECPLPPTENWLEVAIEAGEKTYE
ncbi:DUF1684 domain-containing protein (plasmid) [Halorussus limi]|uniref:DUF1684 domain-containing protein n=1 Tax=Halorussus limi TaxID=2938695 RepID=A0A8U0I049_9EURY|nr:DUF1684 domain-containing protein [Halorussus limi]UPV76316.1 DUF1684 domain-containing protein [Halorussus limi]